MADSHCTSGKMGLMPRHPEKKQQQRKIALSPDVSLLFNKLCDELVEEVLVRLPTTSAVQSKLVCKKWYSIISSPSFVSHFIHLRHGRDRDVQSSIVFQFTYTRDSTDQTDFQIISDGSLLRNLYGEGSFQLSYLPCPPNHLRLEGSSADLILCSYLTPTTENTTNYCYVSNRLTRNETNYYVSNLLTKKWIALPPPPAPDEGFSSWFSIGFLCEPLDTSSQHKFMVIRLYSCQLSQFKVQLFSSQDFKWRTLDVSSSLPLMPYIRASTLVAYRGMLHWLNSDSGCIVVYDPCNNPNMFSRIIQLPVYPPLGFHIHGCFGVSQGHLRVALNPNEDNRDAVLDVWELEDYDSGLWNLVYKIHFGNLIHNKSGLCPPSVLSFHPENRDVIYLRVNNGAVLLNMKSRIIEGGYRLNKKVRFSGFGAFHLADQCWPTAVH